MNVTFSVPAFPPFKGNLAGLEYQQHAQYMRRFENYACAALKCQVEAVSAVAEAFAKGNGAAQVELEMKRMREVVDGLVAAASGVVERATLAVETEMTQAKAEIVVGVRSAVEAAVEFVEVDEPVVVSCCSAGVKDESVCASVGGASGVAASAVGAKTLENRAKRHRRAALRRERKVNEDESVPEWRRKDARASVHKGAFADCSDEVQKRLRESRAEMLVAKNRAAVVQAEHERQRTEARLQARVIEQEVECARLRGVAEYEKLAETHNKKFPGGYTETLLSVGLKTMSDADMPSLTSGSVSPDSSISVAELKRKNDALIAMTAKIAELELKVMKKEKDEREAKAKAAAKSSGGVPKVRVVGGDGYSEWEYASS